MNHIGSEYNKNNYRGLVESRQLIRTVTFYSTDKNSSLTYSNLTYSNKT
jgi:hypothetical protein